jgi:hypothetical protein
MNFGGAAHEVCTIPTARVANAEAGFAMNVPVLGYRPWLIEPRHDGYQLRSVLASARWASTPGAWTGAVCRPDARSGSPLVRHNQTSVPHRECTCGLYAYHSLSIGGYDGRLVQPDSAEIGIVWGAVGGAGRVTRLAGRLAGAVRTPGGDPAGIGVPAQRARRIRPARHPDSAELRHRASGGRIRTPLDDRGDAQARIVLEGTPRE